MPLGSMINHEAIAHRERELPVDTDLTGSTDVRNHDLTHDETNERRAATLAYFEIEQSAQERTRNECTSYNAK